MVTLDKNQLGFLSLFEEMKVDHNEIISIKTENNLLRFISSNRTKGVVISDIEIQVEEKIDISVRSDRLIPLLKSIEGEFQLEVTEHYLNVICNNNRSSYKIELSQFNSPDTKTYFDMLKNESKTIDINDISGYKKNISSFVSKDLSDGFSCVILEKNQMIGFPSGQLVAYQTIDANFITQLKINRLILDFAVKADIEAITIKEYARFSYTSIGNSHLFFIKRNYPEIPPMTEKEFTDNFNHTYFFEIDTDKLFMVLSRLRYLNEDMDQNLLTFEIIDENNLRITDNFQSISEEIFIKSPPELIKAKVQIRTSLLMPVISATKKDKKIKVYITKEKKEHDTMKIVPENAERFYVVTLG